jgi:hypothetical protein
MLRIYVQTLATVTNLFLVLLDDQCKSSGRCTSLIARQCNNPGGRELLASLYADGWW